MAALCALTRSTLVMLLFGVATHALAEPDAPERLDPTGETQGMPDFASPEPFPSPAPSGDIRIEAKLAPEIAIGRIEFVGAAAPSRVADAAAAFIGRPANRQTFKALVDAMTSAYQKSAIVFYTIVIPEQDFSNGVLKVYVAEGHVEAVTLSGEADNHRTRLVSAIASRLIGEAPLKRARYERALGLLREMPGLETTPAISKGAQPGGVKLDLKLDYKKPTITGGYSSRSSRFIRHGQFSAGAFAPRLLREGDVTRIDLAAAANFSDSRYIGLSHSTPLLRDGARLSLSAAYLRSRPAGTPIEGEAKSMGANVSYPIVRSNALDITLRAGVDGVNIDNAAFGSSIATEKTRSARLGAGISIKSPARMISLNASSAHGLAMLDAQTGDAFEQSTYFKTLSDFALAQKIGARGALRVRASHQWSGDALPATERMQFGGARFGRAFEDGLLAADHGYGLSVETSWRPIPTGKLSRSELYGFVDYADGRRFTRSYAGGQSFDLGSFGFGARAAFREIAMIEVEAAFPYDAPDPTIDYGPRYSVRWRVNYRP